MGDFVFEPWELEQENDKMVSVFRWGERKCDNGEVHRIMVTLYLGKGDNPTYLEIYDDASMNFLQVDCKDLPDLLNKMESHLAWY